MRRFSAVLCGRISGCQWFRQTGCRLSIVLQRLCPPGFRLSTVLQWVPHWILVADCLCSDFCSSGFWWSIVLRWVPHRILAVDRLCGDFRRPVSGCQLSCGGFCAGFWLSIAFAAISAARFWLHGFRGLPYRFCRTPAAPAVPVRSRQPPAVPGFRAVVHPNSGREFRRLPQKILSH